MLAVYSAAWLQRMLAVYSVAWLDCSPSDESSLQSHKDLFDLILYVPSTIFQLNRDGFSLVEPVLS